jgi:predicted amidohydrolase
MPDALPVALFAWAAGNRPKENAARLAAAIDEAAGLGSRVLLTPECCLTGYPSASRGDLTSVDWCQVADLEDHLLLHAERRGMVLVLGSAERVADGGCTNDAVVGGAIPAARYRKRCLTPTDRAHFVAGRGPLLVEAFGWKLGIAICYDLRFAPMFHDLAIGGADAFLVISHMAGPDPDPGTKAEVIPQLVAARAAEWATPLAFCNTAEPNRYCDSAVIDVRGRRIAGAGEGLITATLIPRERFDPWYANLRQEHLERWIPGAVAVPRDR